jgi:hypothetical protein
MVDWRSQVCLLRVSFDRGKRVRYRAINEQDQARLLLPQVLLEPHALHPKRLQAHRGQYDRRADHQDHDEPPPAEEARQRRHLHL